MNVKRKLRLSKDTEAVFVPVFPLPGQRRQIADYFLIFLQDCPIRRTFCLRCVTSGFVSRIGSKPVRDEILTVNQCVENSPQKNLHVWAKPTTLESFDSVKCDVNRMEPIKEAP